MSSSLILCFCSLFVCLFLALYQRKYLTGNFRWLFWLICFTCVAESVGLFLMMNHTNNGFVFHILQPIEYALIALFYRDSFSEIRTQKIVVVSIVGFFIFCLVDTLTLEPLSTPNSNQFLIEAILLIGWSTYYLRQILHRENYLPLRSIPEFWISTGILFFYAGAFFLMGLLNYLTKADLPLAKRLFFINHLLNVILYGLYIIGFIWKTEQEKLVRS